MSFIVALDGVLRSDNDKPITEGKYLFEALRHFGRTVIAMNETREKGLHWCTQNGIKNVDDVLDTSVDIPDERLPIRQIQVARAIGRVDLVITSDPDTVLWCLENGVPAMLFVKSTTMHPNFRPDGGARRTWDEITTAIEKRNEAS